MTNEQSKQSTISNQNNEQSAIKTINRDHRGDTHLVFPVGIPLPGPCVLLSGMFLYFVFFVLYFVFCICYSVHFCITNILDYLCWNRWGIFICKLLIILDWKDSSKEFWNKPDCKIEYWRAEREKKDETSNGISTEQNVLSHFHSVLFE